MLYEVITIYGVYYDLGGEGVAYHDNDLFTQWNGTQIRADEGVDNIDKDGDGIPETGKTEAGEWLEYTIIFEPGWYTLKLNAASIAEGKYYLKLDNSIVTCLQTLQNTGNLSTYAENGVQQKLNIPAGQHVLTVVFESSNINLNWISFEKTGEIVDAIETSDDEVP